MLESGTVPRLNSGNRCRECPRAGAIPLARVVLCLPVGLVMNEYGGDEVFEFLRLVNKVALGGEPRSRSEDAQLTSLARRIGHGQRRAALRAVIVGPSGELEAEVLGIAATGFHVRAEAELAGSVVVTLHLRAAGEPDYAFPCRPVAANPRTRAHNLVLVAMPSIELPSERWEQTTRCGPVRARARRAIQASN